MFVTVFFLALTLFTAVVLALLLWRAGAARAVTVWAISALLPLLAAVTASLGGQARADRTLQRYVPAPVTVDITTGNRQYRAALTATDAACLARNIRRDWQGRLNTPQGFIPIDRTTRVGGALPTREVVEALSIKGQLNCSAFSAPRFAQ